MTKRTATGRRPTRSELEHVADVWRMSLSDAELETIAGLADELLGTAEEVAALAPPSPHAPGRRDAGRRPTPDEDPYNAIIRWCDVELEGAEGLLSGMSIALKDCIAVAGVPLTGGSTLLDGFVPEQDSPLARRVLEAGGRIVAMTNMDCLAWSGYGDTSAHGPTLNPFDPTRTAGGSSGGSAAAVHYETVDAAFGCDQGGSVRLPAAFCGVIGLKPTYGLLPYTRILGIDQAVDHAGPIAQTAEGVARLLDATAGPDPGDPRQPAALPTVDSLRAVAEAEDDLSGLRIAVVTEGLDTEIIGVTDEVRNAFWTAIDRFAALGATISETSIPAHLTGGNIDLIGCMEGMLALMSAGGNGYQWRGQYWPQLARAVAKGLETKADELSIQVKLILLCAEHLRQRHGGAVYGTARNLHPEIRHVYSSAFADADVLAMPTTPWLAHRLVDPELSPSERILRGWGVTANTASTNVTGHPGISLPAAEANGLTVGVMLIGPHFSEERLLGIARTFEATTGWFPAR
jgi:amidase